MNFNGAFAAPRAIEGAASAPATPARKVRRWIIGPSFLRVSYCSEVSSIGTSAVKRQPQLHTARLIAFSHRIAPIFAATTSAEPCTIGLPVTFSSIATKLCAWRPEAAYRAVQVVQPVEYPDLALVSWCPG